MKSASPLDRALPRIWNKKGIISTLLLPLSWLYGLVVYFRQFIYQQASSLRYRSPVPVIIIGNLYVGGTGKTPAVMAAIQALQDLGWSPGVVSRGYGVTIKGQPYVATGMADASLVGDEPALIARTTCVPVAVHPDRPLAVRALLQKHNNIDIIVADDGLQHLALERDIEIIVQDERGIGNGRLLPAGPLREPASRLRSADLIIRHLNHAQNLPDDIGQDLMMTLRPVQMVSLNGEQAMAWDAWTVAYRDARMAAMAGIGNPARFFGMLQAHNITLTQTVALRDHSVITPGILSDIDTDIILITAKDAVKCKDIEDARIWVVEVHPWFSRADWLATLLASRALAPKTH